MAEVCLSGLLQYAPHHLADLGRWHHARLPPHGLTLVKQNKGRNALNPELLGCCLVLVYVNLNDFELALVLAGYLLQNGGHGFARAAPIGIKINQNRHAGAIDEFGK
jgi:hypothetical protein